MKRKGFFKGKPCLNEKVEQGVIFNSAHADHYTDKVVYGLVITPRCDIDNDKVSYMHYLPVVKYEDWKTRDLVDIYVDKKTRKVNNEIGILLKDHKIPSNLIEGMQIEEIDLLKTIKPSVRSKLKDLIRNRQKILSTDISTLFEDKNLINNVLNDIIKNRNPHFYLIEGWDDKSDYYVVLLREINRLDSKLCMKLNRGFLYDNEEENIKKSDIRRSEFNEMIKSIQCVGSPYMEHILQSFSHNFNRIGVDNINCKIEDLK